MQENRVSPRIHYPELDEIEKLVVEVMTPGFLSGRSSEALRGIEPVCFGGSPGTCWTFLFQNDEYKLEIVYYPKEEKYVAAFTYRTGMPQVPKLSDRVSFSELKETIKNTAAIYFS